MNKMIHRSWHASAEQGIERDAQPTVVSLEFTGTFTEGSYRGTDFSGRIHYDPAALPSERHISFAMYEDAANPVATISVGDQVLSAVGATIYDSIFDGSDRHYDFVTFYGAELSDRTEGGGFVEFYFADEDAATLDGTRMPTARQLCAFPVKQVTFGTNAPGNVLSVGSVMLGLAG